MSTPFARDRGPWIQNWDGTPCYPFDMRPEEVNPEEIAHSLAMQCRFNGKCLRFYSVAEHSVRVSNLVREWSAHSIYGPDIALAGLLHDAGEAYGFPDVCRPVKSEEYRRGEDAVLQVVFRRYGLTWPLDMHVKKADDVLLATERRDLMNESDLEWHPLPAPLPERIEPWPIEEAEARFMETFNEIQERRFGG